ncbi:MAG: ABC transporter ATP-binding protein/permease, partial [Nitratireductor sp.]|nr:ABC transporter ATP-binding protein/permease [Nitratireductor sp.]
WGSGKIILPAGEPVHLVPRTPYFPPGTLRQVLSYPLPATTFGDRELTAALVRMDLGRLAGSLDRHSRWDRELSEEEQRLLAFARLGLHRPKWVVISEALDLFEGDARKRVMAMIERELSGSTIVNIGRPGRDGGLFARVVHLENDPEGHALRSFRPAAPYPKETPPAETAA